MTLIQHGPDYTLFELLFGMTLQNPFKWNGGKGKYSNRSQGQRAYYSLSLQLRLYHSADSKLWTISTINSLH